MYCKFCGSRIALDTTKCASCGAKIDLNDGGQSYFDDSELSAWQNDSVLYNVQTSMPKTEKREYVQPQEEAFERHYEKAFSRPQEWAETRASRSRARSKKKKNVFLNMISSNKLIIFCISSALAVVLLAVSIIAVLNSGSDENSDDITNQTNYNQQIDSNSEQQDQERSFTILPDDKESDTAEDEKEETDENSRTEVEDIKVIINGEEISHPVSAYVISDKIYVSLDRVLKNEGYKAGAQTSYDKNRIIYEHTINNGAIEIEKGTNKIWIRESDSEEEVQVQYLEGETFNVGSDTFVPAASFFSKIGYSNANYDDENKILTIEK